MSCTLQICICSSGDNFKILSFVSNDIDYQGVEASECLCANEEKSEKQHFDPEPIHHLFCRLYYKVDYLLVWVLNLLTYVLIKHFRSLYGQMREILSVRSKVINKISNKVCVPLNQTVNDSETPASKVLVTVKAAGGGGGHKLLLKHVGQSLSHFIVLTAENMTALLNKCTK